MSIDNITRHKKIFNSYEEMDEFVTENEGRTIEIFGYTSMTCVEDMSTKYVLEYVDYIPISKKSYTVSFKELRATELASNELAKYWVPVKEALPSEPDMYRVTYENRLTGKRGQTDVLYNVKNREWVPDLEVVAWMRLPELYLD